GPGGVSSSVGNGHLLEQVKAHAFRGDRQPDPAGVHVIRVRQRIVMLRRETQSSGDLVDQIVRWLIFGVSHEPQASSTTRSKSDVAMLMPRLDRIKNQQAD